MRQRLLTLSISVALLAGSGCESARQLNGPPRSALNRVPTIEQDVRLLASDEFEGRGIGTGGLDRAAGWIAGRFASLGLQPAFEDSYFQAFDYGEPSDLTDTRNAAPNDDAKASTQPATEPTSRPAYAPPSATAPSTGPTTLATTQPELAREVKEDDPHSPPSRRSRSRRTVSKPTPAAGERINNVAAILPGRGVLAKEYVVVGAHYDHVGYGGMFSRRMSLHEVHNGADDNASGTAAMLAMAARLAETPAPRNARSVIFIAFTGEEAGLLGSRYFVKHSPVPVTSIASMFNLDMVGRLRDDTMSVGGTGTASAFDAIIDTAFAHASLKRKEFGRGGFGPSDHASFAAEQIPVLFFFSGMHPEYHTPGDDVELINFAGIETAVDAGVEVVSALRTMARPTYDDAADRGARSTSGGPKALMRFIPGYGDDEEPGVYVEDVLPDGPAATAGILSGDRIISINGADVADLYEYMDAMKPIEPGTPVQIGVKRGETTLTVTAVPEGRE